MPRIVDHQARRREIAAAVWRVVRREGIVGVSVRSVAAEAGTSPGSLRHYFATQDELLGFAMRSVVDRATARVGDVDALRGRAGAITILEQLLPLDEERRDELIVYLAFLGRPLTDPDVIAVRDEMESLSRAAVRLAVDLLDVAESRAEDFASLLYPLIDGLALHGVQWPDQFPPQHLRAMLVAFIDLATRRRGAGAPPRAASSPAS